MTDKEILEVHKDQRQPVECWCRCMGYYAVRSQYNKGKQSEFNERKWFTEEYIEGENIDEQRRCA